MKYCVFLCGRCGSKQGEEDYRPLFENFVHDLLSTVNKPEWPAAELLLSLLGRLLVSITSQSITSITCHLSTGANSPPHVFQVHQFSNKQTEMALRVASLDYLGTVASRLRKDAVTSKMDQKAIDRILREVEEKKARLFICQLLISNTWTVLLNRLGDFHRL